MATPITSQVISHLTGPLENHPLYGEIRTIKDLRRFMEHHVYSVWDFMSLIKKLQSIAAPVQYPWTPQGDPAVRRFINELVMEEESDQSVPDEFGQQSFFSHFELYCQAMEEIGADTSCVKNFVQRIEKNPKLALDFEGVPAPSKIFTQTTFKFIQTGQSHVVAASLALGREFIVPMMFRSFLAKMGIQEKDAPRFHLYLNRHIVLDQDFHGPMSLRLLNALCGGDSEKQKEAISAAEEAIRARIAFWDGVLLALKQA